MTTPRAGVLTRGLGGLSSSFWADRPFHKEQKRRHCGTKPCGIILVEVTVNEYVSMYALRISAGPSSDLGLFTSRYEACRLLNCSPRVPRKSVSNSPLDVLDRERTEHGAKTVRLDTPRVHANFVYDLTKLRLPPVQHA